ncbi:Methyltransferase domain-containing protein [Ruminococcaceae bacterium YRB3002]|nr:Methyltransferase domain-containing protein [Ruminococcaceae bacterium YRB3002]
MIKLFVTLSVHISRLAELVRDLKICGTTLGRFVPTPYAASHGATGSQSVPYLGLEDLFENHKLGPDDSFIDIGCGKGRVLAYMVSKGVPCSLAGVEINPEVASVARQWSARYSQISIITGDAFELDYNNYTVLFMYRPMETDAFISFVNKLERELRHRIMLYYYADSESGYYLNDRPGWHLISRHEIFRERGLYIHKEPQRYSVWSYQPAQEII